MRPRNRKYKYKNNMTIHSKVAVLNQKQGHFFFFLFTAYCRIVFMWYPLTTHILSYLGLNLLLTSCLIELSPRHRTTPQTRIGLALYYNNNRFELLAHRKAAQTLKWLNRAQTSINIWFLTNFSWGRVIIGTA